MRRYCTSASGAPDGAQNEFVRQHLAGVRDQKAQQIVFPRRQLNLFVAHGDDPAHEIHGKIAALEERLLALLLQPVTKRCADAREQFVDPERLRDIVVGAKVEGLTLPGFVRAAGKHDHRERSIPMPGC